MISGNHFPPNPHVWLQRKMKFSRNSFPVDEYLLFYTLIFGSNHFQKEREREKERERRESPDWREGEEKERAGDWRGARSSDEREERAGDWRGARSSDRRSTSSAIVDRDCRSRSSIAPLVGRSHRSHLRSRFSRAISSSPPLRDLNLTGLDEFFCWVLFLLWMSVELIHYLHVYSWGSVWKIGHVKHFL